MEQNGYYSNKLEEAEKEKMLPDMKWLVHYTCTIDLTSNVLSFKVKEKYILGSLLICSPYQITLTQTNGLLTRRNLAQLVPTNTVLFFPNSSQKSQISDEDFACETYIIYTLGKWDSEVMWLLKNVWSNGKRFRYPLTPSLDCHVYQHFPFLVEWKWCEIWQGLPCALKLRWENSGRAGGKPGWAHHPFPPPLCLTLCSFWS